MQVPKDPHGTQLYWEYLVPADGIGAAKLARTETSVCLCFMGSSQTKLACKTHMGASEANRKPRRLCRSRRVRHSCG